MNSMMSDELARSDTGGGVTKMSSWVWPAIIALLLSSLFFADAALNLVSRWGSREELSHSYFIPVVSAWLIWTNRDAVRASIGAPSAWSIGFFAVAALMALLGQLVQFYVLQHVGLIVAIAGAIAAFGGLSLLRTIAAPVAFLLFAVPPPQWAMTLLSLQFQEMSSVFGVWMLRMIDVPVYLTGNIIDLGEYKLQVAEACSGLSYLFPFVSLGVITAYLYRGPFWQKGTIVLATLPITILMNSFRIAATGLLVKNYGIGHAEGFMHFFEGWVVFILCLAALFLVVMALNATLKPKRSVMAALRSPDLQPATPKTGGGGVMVWGVCAAIMAVSFALAATVLTRDFIIPDRKAFIGVPYEFPGRRHEIRPISAATADVLGADDAIITNLYSDDDEVVNLYMAYLQERRDGRTWHSPRQCIPGGGWRITSHTVEQAVTPQSGEFPFNRLIIENQGQRQLVYYWYDQRGRKIANEFVMQFWTVWDSVTRRRPDGALVRLITPIAQDEPIEAAEQRLFAMITEVDAVLPAYVPH